MALRFTCGNCDSEIVTQYLKVGEKALCRECNKYNFIPDNAAEIDNLIQTKVQELDELAKPRPVGAWLAVVPVMPVSPDALGTVANLDE